MHECVIHKYMQNFTGSALYLTIHYSFIYCTIKNAYLHVWNTSMEK